MSGRFGNGSNSNGQFWYGSTTNFPGFLYKKNIGVGGRRSTKFAAGGNITCNKSTYLYNKYKPGTGGVGASSIANRRAKNRHATICSPQNCFPCYMTLGQYNNYLYNPNGFYQCSPIPPGPPLFSGSLEISNWTQSIVPPSPSGGIINIGNAPNSITIISGNSGQSGNAYISVPITSPQTVNITWTFNTSDGPYWDPFFYTIDGTNYIQVTSDSGSRSQSGTFSLNLVSGNIFGFRVWTRDGVAGPSTTIISGTREI